MSIIKSAYLELVKVLSPVRHARMIGVSLGDNCLVYRSMEWPSEPYLVTIGNNVQLTKGVAIHTHGGGNVVRRKVPDFDVFGKVVIKDWAYIGAHAQIMPGVTIGEGAMVAAGSVVTKSVPDGMVVGGNPAKILCSVEEYIERNMQYNVHTKGIGFHYTLSVLHGMPISQALFELSTLSYWVNHQGAWFIAMLIPVYALTPLHYRICNKVKSPVLYSSLLIAFMVVISALNYPVESTGCQMVIDNVKQVLYHLPSFLIGFMLAPFAKTGKKISYFWMSILPLALVAIMKVMQCGYWPEFLVLPFVAVCCPTFKYMGKIFFSVLNFLGKISLESYLLNVVVGTWIIWYLPNLYNSSMNKGCYLSYFIVCVVGTVLAYLIHLMCNKLFFKSKER